MSDSDEDVDMLPPLVSPFSSETKERRHTTYLHANWCRQYSRVDLSSPRLRQAAAQMLGAQAAAMNARSSQELVGANPDPWSIYGQAGDPGYLVEYDKLIEYQKKYKPWHFAWTHQCNS